MSGKLVKADLQELGEKLNLPEPVSERAWYFYTQKRAKGATQKQRVSPFLWAALCLYKASTEQQCCLTIKDICKVCVVAERKLWKLLRRESEHELLSYQLSAQDLFPKYAGMFNLSIPERRKAASLIKANTQLYPGFSPTTILASSLYEVVSLDRRQQQQMTTLEQPSSSLASAKEVLGRHVVSARFLCSILSTSTTGLFRMRKMAKAGGKEQSVPPPPPLPAPSGHSG